MNFGIEISGITLGIIIGVVLSYFIMVTFFGSYFSKFSSNIHDFFFSGQRFAWWLPFVSLMATGIGAYSYLKYSEQGLNTGTNSAMAYMNDWFITPLFFFGWLPLMYFTKTRSIPQYFEKRFNSVTRYITVFILLAYIFYYIGYNLFTIGLAFQGIFGFSPVWTLPLITFFLGTYVSLGGQTAVIFTDLVQGVILYLAGFLAFGYGLYALGGLDEFISYLPIEHRLPFAPFRSNPYFNSVGIFWGDALAGSIAFLFLNQGFLMRFLSIRSVNEARLAGVANLLITLPLSALVVGSVGWIGKSILTKEAALGSSLISSEALQIENTYHTFVNVVGYVIQHNPIVLGIVLAALLAALMSTIDTLINAATAIFIYDIYKPLINKKASDKHYLKTAKLSTLAITFLSLLLTIWFFFQKGTLMSIHYKGIMVIIPSIVTTLLLGMLWNRFNSISACSALIVGVVLTFMTLKFPEWIYPLRNFFYGSPTGDPFLFRALFGMLTSGLTGVIVCLFTQPADKEKIQGYTLNSIDKAMWSFKKGKPNLKIGKRAKGLKLQIDDKLKEGEISLSKTAIEKMKAEKWDIIYIADERWYLGGLRSGHFRLSSAHQLEDNILLISKNTLEKSYLLDHKTVFTKKII
ncbi:MAG: sodium:solute symporter family protein [Bdellovibrionaceae bacterium]|nr:sodium:solute symporter family protein [Pseudobdellovibrionaceae bacterium]